MPIYLTLQQKEKILDCFRRPSYYTGGVWPAEQPLPLGTKVKCRSRRLTFFIPQENNTVRILNSDMSILERGQYGSATLGDGQIFFHSSKFFDVDLDLDTLPEARRHAWYLPPPEGGECEEDKADRQEENKDLLSWHGVSIGYDVYISAIDSDFKKVVKRVESDRDEKGFLKRIEHPHSDYLERNMRGYHLAPQLYFFPPVIKQSQRGYKKIEFLKDMGENLADFIERKHEELGDVSWAFREALVHAVLLQYLEQLANKHIIHTDIKLMNVCIQEREHGDQRFDITFIDFDGAFISLSGMNEGHAPLDVGGTPGSMAPELFIAPLLHQAQRVLYTDDPEEYLRRLKPDYTMHFCQQTDIFALGVMLEEIGVPETSDFYPLITAMLKANPEERASVDDIRQLCDTSSLLSHNRLL